MSDDVKLVYTGSVVEAMYLEELLKDNGIGAIRKNNLQSSVDAGWASGSPEGGSQLLVESINFDKSKQILDEYFASRKEQ